MSSGTRSTRTRSEDGGVFSVAEVEAIVQKAVSVAVNDIRELVNVKLQEYEAKLYEFEDRLN